MHCPTIFSSQDITWFDTHQPAGLAAKLASWLMVGPCSAIPPVGWVVTDHPRAPSKKFSLSVPTWEMSRNKMLTSCEIQLLNSFDSTTQLSPRSVEDPGDRRVFGCNSPLTPGPFCGEHVQRKWTSLAWPKTSGCGFSPRRWI